MRLLNGLSQDLEAPGERPGRGWVPRRRGGSQNNGIPCVWSPSSTVHIFHESRRGERRECEAGFPQPPPGRSASPAPGPHSPVPTVRWPQQSLRSAVVKLAAAEVPCGSGGWERCHRASPPARPGQNDRCTPQICPASPSQPPGLSRGPLGARKSAGVPSEWPGMLCKAQHDRITVSRSAPTYSYFTHSTHKAGLCGPSPRQTRSSSCGGGSPGVT